MGMISARYLGHPLAGSLPAVCKGTILIRNATRRIKEILMEVYLNVKKKTLQWPPRRIVKSFSRIGKSLFQMAHHLIVIFLCSPDTVVLPAVPRTYCLLYVVRRIVIRLNDNKHLT